MKIPVILLLLASALPLPASAATCENPPTLRFSMVPESDPDRQLAAYGPLLKRLEQRIGRPVEVRRPTSYEAVVEGLLAGSLDVAVLGPASYARARQQNAQVEVFATYARPGGVFHSGGQRYNSLLIVRADSRFHRVDDLSGHSLSLTDPVSTSGAVLPRHVMSQLTGQPLDAFFSRVAYAGTHPRAIQAVMRGEVDAAFVSSVYLERARQNGSLQADEVRVVWRSQPIPEDALVDRSPLCAPLQEAIRDTFLHSAPQERRELEDYLRVSDIVPARDSDYQLFHELARQP